MAGETRRGGFVTPAHAKMTLWKGEMFLDQTKFYEVHSIISALSQMI